jgi:hypothetical protein
MQRFKLIKVFGFLLMTLVSVVGFTANASAQPCDSVCDGAADGTSCFCADVSPAAGGQCRSGTCHARGIYVLETASIGGLPPLLGMFGCTDSYRQCTQPCADIDGGDCNNHTGFIQTEDAKTSGSASHDLTPEARAVAACAEFVAGGWSPWKLLDCVLKGVGTVYRWRGDWGAAQSCPDFAPTTDPGSKTVAVLTHGHPSYEKVRTHSCKYCRCQVDCTEQISNIYWTTGVNGVHLFDKRGVQTISIPSLDIGGLPSTSCESRLARPGGPFTGVDYTTRLENIYESTCQSYCQSSALNACQGLVSPTSVPDGAAWGWCSNSQVSAAKENFKGSPQPSTHTKCLTEPEIPNGPDDDSAEWKWGCGFDGDPWNYSIDGAVYDCEQPSGSHVGWQCSDENVTELDDGRADTTSENLAQGTDEKECLGYRCDGSEQCEDGSACGDCATACSCLEVCDDGFDNDRNGDTDCDDAACSANCGCTDPNADNHDDTKLYDDGSCTYPESDCGDGDDNDGDGDTDCDDSDCSADPACMEMGQCDDGVDNDGDGDIDCDDSDCAGEPECMEMGQCDDGVDNDGDGDIDCDDSDCSTDLNCSESGQCDDGIDNDGDGRIDCADDDCSEEPTCMEMGQCDDGIDNDGDGAIDCDDGDCVGDPACMNMGTPDAEPPVDTGPGPDPDAGVPDAEPPVDTGMPDAGTPCVFGDYRCALERSNTAMDRCAPIGGILGWVPIGYDCSSFPGNVCQDNGSSPFGAYCM